MKALQFSEMYCSLRLHDQIPVLPSYKNQWIDLLGKSIDWFLYEDSTGI